MEIAEKAADRAGFAGTGPDAVAGGGQVVEKCVDIGQRDRLDGGKIQPGDIGFFQRLSFGRKPAPLRGGARGGFTPPPRYILSSRVPAAPPGRWAEDTLRAARTLVAGYAAGLESEPAT